MTRVHHPASHWVLLACLVTMWSTTYLAIKVALSGFDTLTVIAARLVLASLVLLGIAVAAGSRLPRTRVEWGWMLWLALLGNCLRLGEVLVLIERFTRGVASNLHHLGNRPAITEAVDS